MKLSMALIFAKDMARMTAFYREALALPVLEAESGPGWVVFDAGGVKLALHEIPAAIAAGVAIEDPPQARSDNAIKLCFATPDVEQTREQLLARGAVMFSPRPSGACDGLDPEGNVFQIRRD